MRGSTGRREASARARSRVERTRLAASAGPGTPDRESQMPAQAPDKRHLVAPWVLLAIIVALWQAGVTVGGMPAFLLPSPSGVLSRLVVMLSDAATWPYVGSTMLEALGGCVLGAAVALPLAVLIHRSRWVNAAVSPFLGATQAIPAIAIAPLLAIWAGYGLRPIILLCALLVFFPILVAAVVGLRHVDHSIIDAARMDGAGHAALLTQIELPLALPSILGGIRNGFTLSVTGAVVGEMVIGGEGLGQLLTIQRQVNDTAGMFATIVILCALASVAYGAIYLVERRSAVIQSLAGNRT
ncbi:ABC transporter permease [Propioniciclava tarda]|nr:ABC transporter permease [Propioniciclava tarda]